MDCGPGKNGADIMLALDVLEAVLVEGVRNVLIASSDGDSTPLALKRSIWSAIDVCIREHCPLV